jgi:hypothetical protein
LLFGFSLFFFSFVETLHWSRLPLRTSLAGGYGSPVSINFEAGSHLRGTGQRNKPMAGQRPEDGGSLQEEIDLTDMGFLNGLSSAPCFRETALYSIGGGAVLGALHLHRNRECAHGFVASTAYLRALQCCPKLLSNCVDIS